MSRVRHKLRLYRALAAITFKEILAYNLWFWAQLFGQILAMTIVVFFWRAVYADQATVGGLNEAQTITYILLAQMVAPLIQWGSMLQMGWMVREGMVAVELTRPLDLQERFYIENLASFAFNFLQKGLLLGTFAVLAFDLALPTDPALWAVFVLTLLLGNACLFCFDWIFSCIAFYSTEIWGLHVVREGLVMFFSGAMIPLVMLPDWLQRIAALLPFSQALYAPVALLSGIIPLSDAGGVIATQCLWLVGLALASRLLFRVAVRSVTVQGG